MTSEDSNTLLTLSSLLEEHRKTLFTLYQTLGDPESTVEAKLKELHQDLFKAVKIQRQTVEKEVELIKSQIITLETSIRNVNVTLGESQNDDVRSRKEEVSRGHYACSHSSYLFKSNSLY